MKIRTVAFDLDGVILHTENPALLDALAVQLAMTCNELENVVYNSPSANAATVGEITEDDQWVRVLSTEGVPHCQLG